MTKTHFRAIWIIHEEGPQADGTLAVRCGVVFNSNIFKHIRKWKWVVGNPMALTDKGRDALANCSPEQLRRAKEEPKPRRVPRAIA